MARNLYDAPAKKGRSVAFYGAVALAGVVMVGGVMAMIGQQRNAAAADWTPRGAPCPVWTAELPASRSRPEMESFDYGGANLGRWFGHAQCVELHKGPLPGAGVYHACHFTGPDFVRVRIGDTEATFRPGVGKPVIVTLRDGEAACALDPRTVPPRKP